MWSFLSCPANELKRLKNKRRIMSLIQSRVAWRLFIYEDFPKNPVEIKSDPKT